MGQSPFDLDKNKEFLKYNMSRCDKEYIMHVIRE